MDDALLAATVALAGKRVVALTGAGISTESGIPDYRGDKTRALARKPMRFATFAGSALARQRYWARATLGWPRIRDAHPNAGHKALARLEHAARLQGVITQNVDGLHHAAGSTRVVELHGALREVVCLACATTSSRADLHARLVASNPHHVEAAVVHAPDGDVDLDDETVARFAVETCSCGGDLKPRVVFFGENVPKPVVDSAWALFDAAEALLVVGSSLEVFSGRRFVEEAARRRWPIVIINRGATRADGLATVCVDANAGDAVPALCGALSA